MVIGTILARFLENATGQNKVPATIFPSRFWKCFQEATKMKDQRLKIISFYQSLYLLPLIAEEFLPIFL